MDTRHYAITDGQVWLETRSLTGQIWDVRHVTDTPGTLAVAYETMAGSLLKHGSHSTVSAWVESEDGLVAKDTWGHIEVSAFAAHPAMIAMLNACIKYPERTASIVKAVMAMAEQASIGTPKTRQLEQAGR